MILIYIMFVVVAAFVAILLKPMNAPSDIYWGPDGYEREGFERTVDEYSLAIEAELGSAMAVFFKGSTYLMLGQKKKAHTEFLKASKMGKYIPQKTWDLCN